MPEAEVRELEKLISREKFREYLPKIGVSYFGLKNKNENQSDSRYDEYRLHFQQLLYDGGENASARNKQTTKEGNIKDKWTMNLRQFRP